MRSPPLRRNTTATREESHLFLTPVIVWSECSRPAGSSTPRGHPETEALLSRGPAIPKSLVLWVAGKQPHCIQVTPSRKVEESTGEAHSLSQMPHLWGELGHRATCNSWEMRSPWAAVHITMEKDKGDLGENLALAATLSTSGVGQHYLLSY